MYIISPLSRCASPEKSDVFHKHLSDIAHVTQETEHQVQAYAWFRASSDQNNTDVAAHYLRGFEVYETIEASQVTHRASKPYKLFRQAVADEALLERPSDLRFWHPTGIGFLTKSGTVLCTRSADEERVVIYELKTKTKQKDKVKQMLRHMADRANECAGALSFWALDRGDSGGDDLYLFSRWESMDVWNAFVGQEGGKEMEDVGVECDEFVRTVWQGQGLGFLGRDGNI